MLKEAFMKGFSEEVNIPQGAAGGIGPAGVGAISYLQNDKETALDDFKNALKWSTATAGLAGLLGSGVGIRNARQIMKEYPSIPKKYMKQIFSEESGRKAFDYSMKGIPVGAAAYGISNT